MHSFVIYVLVGRCGSNWLAALLSPACLLDWRELWQPLQLRRAREMGVQADPFRDPSTYLRDFCAACGGRGARTMPHWMNGADERLLAGVDRTIALYRRNVTEQMVSLELARRCGWVAKNQHDPNKPMTIRVGQTIERFEESRQTWERAVGKARCCRVVAYEDIADRAQELRKFVALDGNVPELPGGTVQRSRERYRRLVANWDEIDEAMGGRYGRLFGELGTAAGELDAFAARAERGG